MNNFNLSSVSKCLSSPFLVASSAGLAGGYALNYVCIAVNRFVVERLGLPVDMLEGKNYDTYTKDLLEANKQVAARCGVGLDRQLGACLSDFSLIAVREEISYRFLLEKVILPFVFPQFALFSLARTCVSSVLFAARHLPTTDSTHSKQALTAQFFHTAVLGVVCSIAQEKLGLIASIFTHIGFNVYGWQYMYKQNFSDIPKKIREVKIVDAIGLAKIKFFIGSFVDDVLSPYRVAYKLGSHAVTCLTGTTKETQRKDLKKRVRFAAPAA